MDQMSRWADDGSERFRCLHVGRARLICCHVPARARGTLHHDIPATAQVLRAGLRAEVPRVDAGRGVSASGDARDRDGWKVTQAGEQLRAEHAAGPGQQHLHILTIRPPYPAQYAARRLIPFRH